MTSPIAFFDLDGTLRNTFDFRYPRAHQVTLYPGVPERLIALRNAGYLLVGITNQGGVSRGQIKLHEVELANARTQDLLGEAKLDLLLYCPHHRDSDGHICDCKKPAPGMLLNALSALPGSTLAGSFVVGDSLQKDKGAADMLTLPFVLAETFRHQSVEMTLASLPSTKPTPNALSDDRIAGALVGMAVGDAFAAPVEFWARAKIKQVYPTGLKQMRKSAIWDLGEYTDDTQMALLIADSLLEHSELRPQDIAARFRVWARTAKDVGNQTRRVMNMAGYQENPESCAKTDYVQHPKGAAGNGAVMRCAPIALFHAHSPSMLLADSRRSARLTHGDPEAQASCVLVNAAILHFLRGGGKENAWQHGMKFLTAVEREKWFRLDNLANLGECEIQSGGYTVSTVEAAFWSFQHSDSFEGAIELAASLGDDADTVAAVTGALAGAYYGYSAIPAEWRAALKDEACIHQTALQLARAV